MPSRTLLIGLLGLVLTAVFAAPLFPGLRLAFAAVCHQVPERCLEWHGLALPLCARCLGLWTGALAAALWPRRAPLPLLWMLAALNALEWVSGAGAPAVRFLLAVGLAFCAPALASPHRAAAN